MHSSQGCSDVAQLVVDLVDARLFELDAGDPADGSEAIFDLFADTVTAADAALLRDIIQGLSDVAWDLADSWARNVGDTGVVRRAIRDGTARGW